MVTLLEGLSAKTVPNLITVDRASHLESDRHVAALNGKIETGLGVLDEMESNLRVTLLLEIPDNALTDKVTGANDLQYLVVVLPDESQLEAVLCGINGDGAGASRSVEAVDGLALDTGEVNWLFESFDDAVVAIGKSVLDVVESCVNEDAAVIPGSRLDTDSLMDQGAVAKSLVGDGDGYGQCLNCFMNTYCACSRERPCCRRCSTQRT